MNHLRSELTEVRKLIDRLLGGGGQAETSAQYRHYDNLTQYTPTR
jgi:hypothetical protein